MKRFIVSLTILFVTLFNSSCKKIAIQDETTDFQIAKKSKEISSTQARVMQDCQYTKLTQTSPGVWQANFGGVNLTFSDLHLKSYDPRLFGRLISAGTGTGNIILTGNEDYNQRTFTIQQPYCTGGGSLKVAKVTTTMSSSTYYNISQYAEAYVLVQAVLAGTNTFNPFQGSISVGEIVKDLLTTKYQQTTYSIEGTSPMDCSQTRIVVGKLLAKGVTQLPNGQYTWTEVGVANMCYPEPKVPLPQ